MDEVNEEQQIRNLLHTLSTLESYARTVGKLKMATALEKGRTGIEDSLAELDWQPTEEGYYLGVPPDDNVAWSGVPEVFEVSWQGSAFAKNSKGDVLYRLEEIEWTGHRIDVSEDDKVSVEYLLEDQESEDDDGEERNDSSICLPVEDQALRGKYRANLDIWLKANSGLLVGFKKNVRGWSPSERGAYLNWDPDNDRFRWVFVIENGDKTLVTSSLSSIHKIRDWTGYKVSGTSLKYVADEETEKPVMTNVRSTDQRTHEMHQNAIKEAAKQGMLRKASGWRPPATGKYIGRKIDGRCINETPATAWEVVEVLDSKDGLRVSPPREARQYSLFDFSWTGHGVDTDNRKLLMYGASGDQHIAIADL